MSKLERSNEGPFRQIKEYMRFIRADNTAARMLRNLPEESDILVPRYAADVLRQIVDSDEERLTVESGALSTLAYEFPLYQENNRRWSVRRPVGKTALFIAYIEGLKKKGFITIKRNAETNTMDEIALTPQGEYEVDFYKADIELKNAPAEYNKYVAAVRDRFVTSARERFKFWRDKVRIQKVHLAEDEKNRIVAPTLSRAYVPNPIKFVELFERKKEELSITEQHT